MGEIDTQRCIVGFQSGNPAMHEFDRIGWEGVAVGRFVCPVEVSA